MLSNRATSLRLITVGLLATACLSTAGVSAQAAGPAEPASTKVSPNPADKRDEPLKMYLRPRLKMSSCGNMAGI